jgi:MFS transporter, UMF1 family
LYDFANSAFATVILAVIYNRYYAGVVAGGAEGVTFSLLGKAHNIHGTAMFNFVVTISMLLVAISAPILGAWADSRSAKKKFLFIYVILGVFSTSMLATIEAGEWIQGGFWFIMANFAFAGGNVFYNAFLREIASPEEMGRVSGWGWGIGYLGGGLLLVVILILLQAPGIVGLKEGQFTVQHSFILTAIWWGLFSIPTFRNVKERSTSIDSSFLSGAKESFIRLKTSFKNLKRYRQLWLFLLAYLFFNDGIETVIIMAAIFGDQVLGMDQGLLIAYFLLIQFTAFGGSIIFGKLTTKFGNKRALMSTLVIWCGVVTAAFFIGWTGKPLQEYFVIGILAGIVMGASQSIARAIQGTFTPKGHEAEFFGFFAISGRFAAIFGPLTYGIIVALTGSLKIAILSLIVFFLVGIAILAFVDEKEGLQNAELDL